MVTDDGTPNLTDTETITITVTETNVAPVVVNPGNQADAETDVISLFVAATDADLPANTLTWSATGLPPLLSINPATGEIFGTLTYTSAGSYPVSVTATDDGTPNLADTVNFTWDVTNTNRIPIVVNPGNQTNNENDIISLTLAGSDPDGGPVTWSAINLPPGLSINPTTGEISGTLTYTSAGIHAIQATATDSELAPTIMAFTWTVNDINRVPVLDPVGGSSIAELTLLAFTATGSDPDLDGLTFSLVGEPAGAAITAGGDFTFTATEAQGPGSFTFDVVVTDDGTPNLADTETITITVTETNVAPVVTNPGNQTDAETDVISLFVAGTDADVPANTLTWSATDLPALLSINPATGEIFGTLTYTSAGSYPVSVTATDDGTPNLADTVNFTWDVTNTNRTPIVTHPGNQTHAEGDSVTLNMVGTDPDLDTLTWSAVNLPPALTINPTTGQVTGTLNFSSAGLYATQIVAFDGTNSAAASITWTVTNTNQSPVLDPVGDSSIAEQTLLAFTATGSDPDLDGLTFSLSGEPAGAAITAGGAFAFTPTEAQGPGSYTFDVVITDDGTPNLADTETITITVTETNVAPVVVNPGNQADAETDVISLFVAGSDPDVPVNVLTWSAAGLPAGLSINPATGEIFGTLPLTSAGTYPVSVTATDDGTPNLADTINFTWTVTNTNQITDTRPDR